MKVQRKHIAILISIFVIVISTNAQDNGLEFYIVNHSYPDLTEETAVKNCYYCFKPKKSDLVGVPIVTQNDIEFFDWDRQQIKLTDSGIKKLDSLNIPLQGLAIALTINKEPIYGLWFWNEISSFGCDATCTFPRIDFKIKFGMPFRNRQGTDPRYNNDLLEHLLKTGFIYKTPNEILISNCLNDTTISQYFKYVFNSVHLLSNPDDNVMLTIADSLFSTIQDRQLFYFLVFTKSMNKSDGFYSEAIGLSATKFITEQTENFADYFNNVRIYMIMIFKIGLNIFGVRFKYLKKIRKKKQ